MEENERAVLMCIKMLPRSPRHVAPPYTYERLAIAAGGSLERPAHRHEWDRRPNTIETVLHSCVPD